jgi:hypothetical protein
MRAALKGRPYNYLFSRGPSAPPGFRQPGGFTNQPYNGRVKKRAARPAKLPSDIASDPEAFAREMADVIPLPRDRRGRIKERHPVVLPATEAPRAAGPGGFDESGDDFAAPGIDRREIRRLKRGAHPVTGRRE